MPKCSDDSATGEASLGRNDLPHVRFGVPSTEAVNSPPNFLARGAAYPLTDITTCCSDKMGQHLVEGPVPSCGSYEL
jgi:hypothetical protein